MIHRGMLLIRFRRLLWRSRARGGWWDIVAVMGRGTDLISGVCGLLGIAGCEG